MSGWPGIIAVYPFRILIILKWFLVSTVITSSLRFIPVTRFSRLLLSTTTFQLDIAVLSLRGLLAPWQHLLAFVGLNDPLVLWPQVVLRGLVLAAEKLILISSFELFLRVLPNLMVTRIYLPVIWLVLFIPIAAYRSDVLRKTLVVVHLELQISFAGTTSTLSRNWRSC